MSGGGPRQERQITLPSDVAWHRVHPITPLLEGWKAITAVVAFLLWQNIGMLSQAYTALQQVGQDSSYQILLWALGLTAAVLVVFVLGMWLSWRMRSYAVDRDAVYLRTGVLNRQLRTARLPRIQSVDVVHPLLGRVFGLGRLTVEVAGGGDSRVSIGFLRTSDLEALRDQVLTLAAGASTEPGAGPADAPPEAAHVPAQAGAGTAPAPAPAAPAAPLPLGFEDAAQAAPLSRRKAETEEHYLYEVSPKTLLGAQLLSGMTFAMLAMLTGMLVVLVWLFVLHPLDEDFEVLAALSWTLPALAIPVAFVSTVWSRFDKGWRFRAAATPAGIRMRYGLTSETSSTLPPGRVHGLELSQGLLWRGPDWWQVKASVAGRSSTSEGSTNYDVLRATVLLPVGSRDLALRSLWLVVPDLGVADPAAFTHAALSGRDNQGVGQPTNAHTPGRGFIRICPRGRLFSPLGWRREAIALTDTCVVLRLGRWRRRVSVIPYERVQSLSVSQGPLARRLGLATVHLDMVDDQVTRSLANLDLTDAAQIEQDISQRALWRSRHEQLDRWLARATSPQDQAAPHAQAPTAG